MRRGRVLGGPAVRAACGGIPSLPGGHAELPGGQAGRSHYRQVSIVTRVQAEPNAESRGQSGDRLALSGLPRSADSVHLARQLSVGFGRLLAVGGAADGGEATSKAAREAGYRLGRDRGSPNHGSTLASKRVMAQIW